MFKIQKILVATDFSEHSDTAMLYAAELSRVFDAEVLICHSGRWKRNSELLS